MLRSQWTPTEIDSILSKELLELPLRDRNSIDEEIHGVSTLCPKETPELLDAALVRLSEEIDHVPDASPKKAAYLRSQEFDETYVNEDNFRLRFLRCELFDAKKAAARMITFLDFVLDLFGEELLKRPIRISDFHQKEIKDFRKGPIQLLPYRDRSGRPIYAWVGDFGANLGDERFRAKMAVYIFCCMSEDIESQQKGFVAVCWVGSNANFTASLPSQANYDLASRFMMGLPIRMCATHFCLPDLPYFHLIRSMFAMSMGPYRNRIKFHIGEEIELQYALRGFGIPFEIIPVTGTGNIKTLYWRQWMRLRRTLELAKVRGDVEASTIIEIPRSCDVIFRTGNSLTCHPGNSMFQSIIESKAEDHINASQAGKMAITKEIINVVKQKNGRFLQWDSQGWWVEIKGDTLVHSKVAVSVRDFKSKSVAKQNQQKNNCSTALFRNQDGKRRKINHDPACDSDSSASQDICSLLPIHNIDFCNPL